MNNNSIITVSELAAYLKCSKKDLYRKIRLGEIPGAFYLWSEPSKPGERQPIRINIDELKKAKPQWFGEQFCDKVHSVN